MVKTKSFESRKTKQKILNEREIANYLILHLTELGYIALKEFVLTDKYFDIEKLTGKKISKVRIDVAALKDEKITFIEIENGLWSTHPLLYRNFAHRVFVAYPAEANNPTDHEQIKLAKSEGIGVIKVSSIGSVISVIKPIEFSVPKVTSETIVSLFNRRFSR